MKILTKDKHISEFLSSVETCNFARDIVVIDEQDLVSAKNISPSCIVLVKDFEASQVINLAATQHLSHVLQINRPDIKDELLLSLHMITTPDLFLREPMSVILPSNNNEIFRCRVEGSKQKEVVKKQLADLIEQASLTLFKQPLLLLVDELIMNAVYDAPQDSGVFRNLKSDRHKSVSLLQHESSEIIVSRNKNSLCVVSIDPFGSLNSSKLLARMDLCYTSAGSSINFGAGGAGVGCQMMFDRSSSFCIGVKPGVRTVFSCVLPLKYRNRAAELCFKNLHIVEAS